jgi:hypothetical protein
MIVDYDSSMPEEVMMWQRIIASSGGEVETVYGPRVTHVLCETQKSATFQRVTSAIFFSRSYILTWFLTGSGIELIDWIGFSYGAIVAVH